MILKEETWEANAKINLTLDLTGILPDGYHAIYTVMQSVDLCDTIQVRLTGEGLCLACSDPSVPTDRRNTVYKAAEAFFAFLGKPAQADIYITKRIPSQAGLGGGSADAAAALRCLNHLYDQPVPEEKLLKIALQVGADVPFCLTGGTRLCLNKGEVMAPLSPFSAHVVIAKPDVGISTAEAFRKFDTATQLSHPRNDDFLFHFTRGDYAAAFRCAGNLFQQLTNVPEVDRIISSMRENGAYYAAMSGSGSACFGLFHTAEAAGAAAQKLQAFAPFVAQCKTTERGTGWPEEDLLVDFL